MQLNENSDPKSTPLNLTEAAKLAGVSTQTLRRKRKQLEAVGAITSTNPWQVLPSHLEACGMMTQVREPVPIVATSHTTKALERYIATLESELNDAKAERDTLKTELNTVREEHKAEIEREREERIEAQQREREAKTELQNQSNQLITLLASMRPQIEQQPTEPDVEEIQDESREKPGFWARFFGTH